MKNVIETLITKVSKCHTCEDAFGKLEGGTPALQQAELRRLFIEMAEMLHPDRSKLSGAADALAALTAFRARAVAKLKAGTYGKPDVAPVTIKSSRLYSNVQPYAKGDLCDVFTATTSDEFGKPHGAAIKILRDPRDSDLLDTEAKVLKLLWDPTRVDSDHFTKYLPKLLEATTLDIGGGKKRRANVLSLHSQRMSLATLKEKIPEGIDPRDMAWMFRRVLEMLTWVHRQGFIHGAVTPDHVLVSAHHHGAKLIDWSYACNVEKKERIKAVSTKWEKWYPPEVFDKKQPITAATDVYMAARIADRLVTPALMPPAMRRLFDICQQAKPAARYANTWQVYEEFDLILKKLYGKPTFREFKLPV